MKKCGVGAKRYFYGKVKIRSGYLQNCSLQINVNFPTICVIMSKQLIKNVLFGYSKERKMV